MFWFVKFILVKESHINACLIKALINNETGYTKLKLSVTVFIILFDELKKTTTMYPSVSMSWKFL